MEQNSQRRHMDALVNLLTGRHSNGFQVTKTKHNYTFHIKLNNRTPRNLAKLKRLFVKKYGRVTSVRGRREFVAVPWGNINISRGVTPEHKPPDAIITIARNHLRHFREAWEVQRQRGLREEVHARTSFFYSHSR